MRFFTLLAFSLFAIWAFLSVASCRAASPKCVAGAHLSVCVASGARPLAGNFREFQDRSIPIGFVSTFGALCLATQVLLWFGAHALVPELQFCGWLISRLALGGAVWTDTVASWRRRLRPIALRGLPSSRARARSRAPPAFAHGRVNKRARRELRIRMYEGAWARGICLRR